MQPCAERLQEETVSTPISSCFLCRVCRNHGRNSKGSCAVFEPARSFADLRYQVVFCSIYWIRMRKWY
jgi:hypothetical protein